MSESLYQLAETFGSSRTIPGTLGLWALVVDAAPHDVKDMSEGLLATMIEIPNRRKLHTMKTF